MPEISQSTCDAIDWLNPPAVVPVKASPAVEQIGVLNDDVMIHLAPDRPNGTIRVKMVYTGRSTPIPADDPWAE
jgi:hypothetical protein